MARAQIKHDVQFPVTTIVTGVTCRQVINLSFHLGSLPPSLPISLLLLLGEKGE